MAGLPYFPTTLPAQTVVGNLAATPREAQAIPIAALSGQLADASTINFTPAGAGAVARSVQSKERDDISVFDFMTAAQIADVQARTLAQDVTAAIQAASDAILLAGGGTLFFPAGTYKITSTLTFLKAGSAIDMRYMGAGCLNTILSWNGATNSTAVKIQRLVRFKIADFSIANAVATGTTVGLNVTAEAASGSDTGPAVFDGVRIGGFNKNYVVGATGSGKAASEFTYINFEIASAATTGIELNGANSLDHTFIQLLMTSNATGMEVLDPDCVHVLGGSASGNTVQDFALRAVGEFSIRNFRSESANRFITVGPDAPAGGSSPTILTIDTCRVAATLAADLRAVRLNKAVQARIINSNLQQGHIYFDTGLDVSSSVTIEENTVVDTVLYEIGVVQQSRYMEVLTRGNRKSVSSGNQFWDDEHFILNLSAKLYLDSVDLSTISAPKQFVSQVLGLSSTSTQAKNLRGQVTFTGTATKAVAFATNEPDASYFVAISGNVNETFFVTAKAVGGFTLNSSNAASVAVVDWHLIR